MPVAWRYQDITWTQYWLFICEVQWHLYEGISKRRFEVNKSVKRDWKLHFLKSHPVLPQNVLIMVFELMIKCCLKDVNNFVHSTPVLECIPWLKRRIFPAILCFIAWLDVPYSWIGCSLCKLGNLIPQREPYIQSTAQDKSVSFLSRFCSEKTPSNPPTNSQPTF